MRLIGCERDVIPHAVVLLFLCFAIGCAEAEDSDGGGCDVGSGVPCLCSDGTYSVKLCPDGSEYSVCQCSRSEDAITATAGFGGAAIAPDESDDFYGLAGLPSERSSGVAQAESNATEQIAPGTNGIAGSEVDANTENELPDEVEVEPELELEHFSFFVTSLEALQRLSGSPTGFGGDLRYGEADGLSGADKICTEIAEYSMPGSGQKGWRAFLSATKGGPNDGPVHAIERVGSGPWYDRLGRVVAMTTADLVNVRPLGADPSIVDDLPNEYGVPNHAPDGVFVDNHHVLTGSNQFGMLIANDPRLTCQDWTSAVGTDGTPTVGMSWPRMGGGVFALVGGHWISDHNEAGCAPVDFTLIAQSMGGGRPGGDGVGSGGGYGSFYCFALTP
jgi:hypothetical protein